MTFDEALAALLALVGDQVEVHVLGAGDVPFVVTSLRGELRPRPPREAMAPATAG